MEDTEYERQFIVDYMASQAADETVEHLEKVASERALGREIDVWDVHTDIERWWVITSPINLYSQKQFPSLDIALSFHIGLTARVMERSERTAPIEQAERFPIAWRKWEQAGEALNDADEAEEFQSIGMRCREALIAFAREASTVVAIDEGTVAPKAGDYNGWSDFIANTIAGGTSAERRRGYLKSAAKSTWELVNSLTHGSNATRFDAYFAFMATGHVLSSWSLAILRFELKPPERCPRCQSYRLETHYEHDDENKMTHVAVCEVCDWASEPIISAEPTTDLTHEEQSTPPKPEDAGDCIFVDIPLRGPRPPKRSR